MHLFLQPGNYFEAGISVLDPDVSGKDTSQNDTGDMANYYYSPNAALKLQATEHFSIGLIYDQPYGANAQYSGKNNFIESRPFPFKGGTSVTVDTEDLNLILRYQPNQNHLFYQYFLQYLIKVKLRQIYKGGLQSLSNSPNVSLQMQSCSP